MKDTVDRFAALGAAGVLAMAVVCITIVMNEFKRARRWKSFQGFAKKSYRYQNKK
jgi:hypothetical protein